MPKPIPFCQTLLQIVTGRFPVLGMTRWIFNIYPPFFCQVNTSVSFVVAVQSSSCHRWVIVLIIERTSKFSVFEKVEDTDMDVQEFKHQHLPHWCVLLGWAHLKQKQACPISTTAGASGGVTPVKNEVVPYSPASRRS